MLFERFCLEELPKLAISLLVNCLAFRIALSFSNPSIIRNQIDVSFWAASNRRYEGNSGRSKPMVAAGVIEQYAIRGAIGAIYYLEPFETSDLDVFVHLGTETTELAPLEPIYTYLREAGYIAEREFMTIEGLPVQFLPSFSPLSNEAIDLAHTIEFDQVQSRIMLPEHLVAIMLATGRAKDYLRINMFLEQDAVDMEQLMSVLDRYDLLENWQANLHKFSP
jgi:hypothetical protein